MRISRPVAAVLGAIAAITMLACGAGTSSSPGTGSAPQGTTAGVKGDAVATVKLGESLNIESFGSKYTVTIANLKTGVKSGNQFTQPSHGQFIVFDATFTVKEGQQVVGPMGFHLQTAEGTVFDWAIAVIKIDGKEVEQSWSTTLNPGQNKSGKVVLDVPKDLTGAKIYLQEFDKPAGYWAL